MDSPPPKTVTPAPFMLGACWYPEQWPEESWRRDAGRMRDAGITVVRVGEFAWSRLQPARGELRLHWLQRVLDILHDCGLRAVIGTPTAAPPRWLLDDLPDMCLVDGESRPAAFGSRRHYCHAHPGYRKACAQIVTHLAKKFGRHPAVIAWQTDNEYGHHGSAHSFSAAAAAGFRAFLRDKYRTMESFNRRYGGAFWSLEYSDFSQINPPAFTPAGHHPLLLLDFYRYSSHSIREFNRVQTEIIRRHSPGRAVLHNFAGFLSGFDHFALGEDLDVAAWDSYPGGFLARHGPAGEQLRYLRTGHPDYAAFHHDLFRGCGRGRMWVMEQQPGPVNWAPFNAIPAAGAVRMWTWEAHAHGAEVVSYFRWRQTPTGPEQMHAGLHTPDDKPAPGHAEVAQTAAELQNLPPPAPPFNRAAVALLVDYESIWMADIQPHGDRAAFTAVLDFYRALRRHGVDVDIISPRDDFTGRKLIVAPLWWAPAAEAVGRLQKSACPVLFGPRCGSRTEDFAIPGNLPPGVLRPLLKLSVRRVESLPPHAPLAVTFTAGAKKQSAAAICWREIVRAEGAQAIAKYSDGEGEGALFASENFTYLACRPNDALLDAVLRRLLKQAGICSAPPPPDVRCRRRGGVRWFFNYGSRPARIKVEGEVMIPASAKIRNGNCMLPPAGVLAVLDKAAGA